ncbi:uncharacterized protein tasor2 isoform X3 [Anguilla rostrata]|uniref:uncharacterized protein tasor2 isoform X3 n=1 Tax=Anguilla rostrata TaxID=7938 RepID=UPI0030D4D5B6
MPYFKRKKARRLTKGLFEPVSPGSGTFQKRILPVLQNSYLDAKSRGCFRYSGTQLVNNAALQRDYQAFHAEKRERGYTEEELEESFGFLLFDQQEKAKKVCENGLRVGHGACSTLGDPSKGVYVWKHSDCLDCSSLRHSTSGFIVILRLTKGRVRPVRENHTQSFTAPTTGFDCHVVEPISDEPAPGSFPPECMQYYLYELSGPGEGVAARPRHVLPFALVAFSYRGAAPRPSAPRATSRSERPTFHWHPWSGQLQIKSVVYHVALKSNTEPETPAALPAVLVVDRVMSVSALREVLPLGVFEARCGREVSLEGKCCSLYEVVTSLAQDSSLALLTLELKQKELALVLQLDGCGLLVLLSSSNFLTYQDPLLGKTEILLAMFVFPDSAVQKGLEIQRSRTSLSRNVLQVLPGLNYAESEIEKCPPKQQGSLCDLVEQHLQSYATVKPPGIPDNPSNEAGWLQEQYDAPETLSHCNSAPKCGAVALQRLQGYLGQPEAYALPVVKTMELLAVRGEERGDDACCFLPPLEEIPPGGANAVTEDHGTPGAAALTCAKPRSEALGTPTVPMSGDPPMDHNLVIIREGRVWTSGLVAKSIVERRGSAAESTGTVGFPCVQTQLAVKPATSKRRSSKRKKVSQPANPKSLGQGGGIEGQPVMALPLPPKRKGFGYGLKTIITDCGRMFIPHGSEILPRDIASLAERQRVVTCSTEEMGSAGAPAVPAETADQPTPITVSADQPTPNTVSADQPTPNSETADQQAPSMHPADRLETGLPVVSPPAEDNNINNSETKIIPDKINAGEIQGSKALISFKELRTVIQHIKRKLKCPDQMLDNFGASLADDEPQQKKSKSNSPVANETQGSKISCRKDVSPKGANVPQLCPKMADSPGSDPTLLGKPQRTDGQDGAQPRRTSPRRLDLPKSSLPPEQTLKIQAPPTTPAKPVKLKPFKKQLRSRIIDSTTENDSLNSDSPASQYCAAIGQSQEFKPDGHRVSPGGVCSGGGSPVPEQGSTSAGQPADALTLLADLALSSSSDNSPTDLSPALESDPSARDGSPAKRPLPLRSPAPEGLVVSGELISIISLEHNYSAPPSCMLGSMGGPRQLQSVADTSPPSAQPGPLGQDNTDQLNVTSRLPGNPSPQCPAAERRKRGSKWARDIVQVGETIRVTRPWKDEYKFGHDSKYTNEPVVKAVMRALHGPWDFGFEDTTEQSCLILHTWIGLFYSRSTTRFFQTDLNRPLLEGRPLALKARRKSRTKEATPTGLPDSEVLQDAAEIQRCAPPPAAPPPPEEEVLDLREPSKKMADPPHPLPEVLDLSRKRSEALDLSKHSSETCPHGSNQRILPKNSVVPLPPPTLYNCTYMYAVPFPSAYSQFIRKEYRSSTDNMSDDGGEQRDDGSILQEDDGEENYDSGFHQPLSNDDIYAQMCERTASLRISKDTLFNGTRRVVRQMSVGTLRSYDPLQSLDIEMNRRTKRTKEGSPCIQPCRLSKVCCTTAETLQPINICHTTAEVLQPIGASDHESEGTVVTDGGDGSDFNKGKELTAVHNGSDFSRAEACTAVHDGMDFSKEEACTAVHDGSDFSKGKENTAVHDGSDFSKEDACTAVHDGSDFSKEKACTAVHDGSDFSKEDTCTTVHDESDFSRAEACAEVHDGNDVSKEDTCTAVHGESDFSKEDTCTVVHDGSDFSRAEACTEVHDGSDVSKEDTCTEAHDGRDFSKGDACTGMHDGSDVSKEDTCTEAHDGRDFSKGDACTGVHDGSNFSMDEEFTAAHDGNDIIEGEEHKVVCDLIEMHDGSNGSGEEMPTAVFDDRRDSVTEMQTALSNGDKSGNVIDVGESASENRSPTPTLDELPYELNLCLSDSQSGTPVYDCLKREARGSRSDTPTQDELPGEHGSYRYDHFSVPTGDLLSSRVDPVGSNSEADSSAYLPQSANIPCPSSMRMSPPRAPSSLDKPFSHSSPVSPQVSEESREPQPLSEDAPNLNSSTSSEEVSVCSEPKSIKATQFFRPHSCEELRTANEEGITISKEKDLPQSLDSPCRNRKAVSQSEPTAGSQSPTRSELSLGLSCSQVSEASPQHDSILPSKDDSAICHSEPADNGSEVMTAEDDHGSDPLRSFDAVLPPSPYIRISPAEISPSRSASDGTSSEGPKALEDFQQSPQRMSSDSKDVNLLNSSLEVVPNGKLHLLKQNSDYEPCHSVTSSQSQLQADCSHQPHQPFSDGKDIPADELPDHSKPICQTKRSDSPPGSGSDSACPSMVGSVYSEHEITGTSAPVGSSQHVDRSYEKSISPASCRSHTPAERLGESGRACGSQGGSDASLATDRGKTRSPVSMEESSDPAAQHTATEGFSESFALKEEKDEEGYNMMGDRESVSSGDFSDAVTGEDAGGSPVGEDSSDEEEIDEALDYSKAGPLSLCSARSEGTGRSWASCSAPHKVKDTAERERSSYCRGGRKSSSQDCVPMEEEEEGESSVVRPSIFTVLDCQGNRRTYENYPITKTVWNEPVGAAQNSGAGSSHLLGFLQKWVEPQHAQPDLTQSSLDLQYLMFSEKMNQILKKHQPDAERRGSAHRYPWRQRSSADVDSAPCGSPATLQFPGPRDCISEESTSKRRLKRDKRERVGLQAPEASPSCYPIDSESPQRLRRLTHFNSFPESCPAVSNIAVECAQSYRAMMNDVCSGKQPQHRPSRLQREGTTQPHRKDSCKQIKEVCAISPHRNLNAANRLSCKDKFRFYILVTSTDAFFEQTRELLEAEGHESVEPDQFDLERRSCASALLVMLRNEDIAEHISRIPRLLELKRTPGVLFAGVDRPDDVLNHTHQELFREGGFTVCDADALRSFTLGELQRLVGLLEELSERSRWKWLLHYRDERELREGARWSSGARRLKQVVDRCQEAGLAEVMPYHECDVISRARPDYLSCLLRLQAQRATVRFPVFITDTPEVSFEKCGILAMNLNTFSPVHLSLNSAAPVDF